MGFGCPNPTDNLYQKDGLKPNGKAPAFLFRYSAFFASFSN